MRDRLSCSSPRRRSQGGLYPYLTPGNAPGGLGLTRLRAQGRAGGAFSGEQDAYCRDYAETTRDHESMIIIAFSGANKPRDRGGEGGSDLVRSHNPAEYEARLFGSEGLPRQRHGGRYGGDPVEAIKHREDRQSVALGHETIREVEEREARKP